MANSMTDDWVYMAHRIEDAEARLEEGDDSAEEFMRADMARGATLDGTTPIPPQVLRNLYAGSGIEIPEHLRLPSPKGLRRAKERKDTNHDFD